MKKAAVLAGLISVLLVSTLVIAGCELVTNIDGDITGVWTGTVQGHDDTTIVINSSEWYLNVPGTSIYKHGTYTLSGNTATLMVGDDPIGTATINGNTMTLILGNYFRFPGTYYLTKDSKSGTSTPGTSTGGTSAPSAPTNVKAEAFSSSSISVSWKAVSGATSYNVYYGIGSSTTKELAGTVMLPETSYTHTGLLANTTYRYYITAVNSAGESGYSDYGFATTSSSGGGTATVTGVWKGTVSDDTATYTVTVNVTPGKWSLFVLSTSITDSGTYELDGNTATLQDGGVTVGTAAISGNTMTLVLNNNSAYPGTYSLTKQ
ncbi:MAG: fibronectin type III domain-containing protein [Treponema sp.]|jgi:hypothetical protein|nr:fibronectin type III domain-containing protein [Treponema sp.]